MSQESDKPKENIIGPILKKITGTMLTTNAKVARMLGITSRRYSHYVNGRNEPSVSMIINICKVLNITPNQLLGFEEYKFDKSANINTVLLEKVLTIIEEEITKNRLTVTSSEKAKIIISLYDYVVRDAIENDIINFNIDKELKKMLGLIKP